MYVVKWLEQNGNANGKWDMGSVVNDKVYFPLSDNWRKAEIREADCTERISRILNKLNKKLEEKNGHYNQKTDTRTCRRLFAFF